MKEVVIDVETENCTDPEMAYGGSSPFVRDNMSFIVAAGWMDEIGPATSYYKDECFSVRDNIISFLDKYDTLVGHNIKFDLIHIRQCVGEDEWHKWVSNGGCCFDTQYAEYLLSAQTHKFSSLDELTIKYRGEEFIKDHEIKEHWAGGGLTSAVPKEKLLAYLRGDIDNTQVVYNAQKERLTTADLWTNMSVGCNAIMALVEIETNGMRMDVEKGGETRDAIKSQVDILHDDLIRQAEALQEKDLKEFSPDSSQKIGAVLFGGEISYKTRGPAHEPDHKLYRIKSGPNKGQIREKNLEGIVKCKKLTNHPTKKSTSTDVNVMEKIVNAGGPCSSFCADILEYRGLAKEFSTYLDNYIHNAEINGGYLHGELNSSATVTGRLSGSKPNIQNITRKET